MYVNIFHKNFVNIHVGICLCSLSLCFISSWFSNSTASAMITEISTGFKVERELESLCETLIILLET